MVNVVKDKLDGSGKMILENQDERCGTFSLEHLLLNTSGVHPLQFYTNSWEQLDSKPRLTPTSL